ncbi:MAG: AAA family ATPase [Myxococcales bacterium]|nr:AAA family ATPase [Myxococcales bacterium]
MQSSSQTLWSALPLNPQRAVVLCVGPGGVGKTTCAATLALAAARAGKRVLVVTIDPSRRLAQALGFSARVEPGAELEVKTPELGSSAGGLYALLLDGKVVFDRLVKAYAADAAAADAILRNPIYKATAQHLGGALEYAAMAQLRLLHDERRYDLIVLDTPPTANALEFLAAPDRVQELVTNPAIRLLTGTGSIGARVLGIGNKVVLKALGAVGGGRFIEELGAFLREFSVVLGAFRDRAGDFQELLSSPATGVILTTSASQFSVREALAFLEVLRQRHLRIDAVVLNRMIPAFPDPPAADAIASAVPGAEDPGAVAALLSSYRGIQIQGRRSLQAVESLASAYPKIPVWALPRREPPPNSLAELSQLAGQFIRVARGA